MVMKDATNGGRRGGAAKSAPDGRQPQRDEQGRLTRAGDLLGVVLAGFVIGVLALVLFDGLMAVGGWGRFGRISGWPAVLLPVWTFIEEFRAWRGVTARVAVALVGGALSLALGLLAAGLTGGLPPLASTGLGALVITVAYAVIWFYGIRWLSGQARR
jgi:hypothetical protein